MSKISSKEDTLTLEYNLFDLPTAQHKAGLAGLLVMIRSMELRKIAPLPKVEITSATARISTDRETFQRMLNDFYNAGWIEKESRQKWKKKEPKRVDEKEVVINGKKKKEKHFIYDAVQPDGAFLQTFYPDGDGLWLKLWRNMLWNILRGIPATRNVYEERAEGKTSSEGKKIWKNLLKAYQSQKKGNLATERLSSSLFVGAEAENAEKIPFSGTVENNFLLNFWHIVSLIYIPRKLGIERKEDKLRIIRDEYGYVLAIPEPYHLEDFIEAVIDVLRSLDTEKLGIRPRKALIDMFEEGGLEYLYHFARKKIDDAGQYAFSLHAIEICHLQKQGNRVRQLAAERILPDFQMINDYEMVRDSFRNPFYKKIYLRNLLNRNAWYRDADAVFHHEPWPIFVHSSKTPSGIRFFGKDVRRKFDAIEKTVKLKKGASTMTDKDHDDQLAIRVYRLIQNYVWRRTEEKSGKKYDDFKNNKNEKGYVIYPQEYSESLVKVCSDAFLAMRSRREQDFIEYFTGTICSVPQFLPESEFLFVADAMMNEWQKVKTLSMLAISANSYIYTEKED